MSACNTKTINTANVVTFGFTTSFDPYNKKVIISIAGETIFEAGGEANINNIAFEVTDPLNEVHAGSINPSDSETEVEITGFSGASLFFGNYHVKGVLTEADASTYEIEFDINVCKPDNLTAQNFAKGCLVVNVDCGRAVMEVYDKTKMLFNGKLPLKEDITYNGSITYPNNYLAQVNNIDYLPYSLDLTDSITGMYQIEMVTTASYDLECGGKLLIQYRSKVNEDVQCGASMCELNCCWTDALDIVAKGGPKGAQMEEKMQLANYYFNAAVTAWSCGNDNEYFIKKVKEILNCDCHCDKGVLIQPRPITYGAKNLIPSCGTSISIDENGDYKFHSFVYVVTPTDNKIKVNTVQTSACTKTTYISLDCEEVTKCIYDFLSDSDNEEILLQWQDLLNINKCPCDDVTITNTPTLLSLSKASPDFATLEDNYFVKNDVLTAVNYKDNTAVVGGTFDFAKYFDQIIQQQGNAGTAGANVSLPCGVCGGSIIGKTGTLSHEVHTTCSCVKTGECELTTPRIDYSERYESAYRFNPQIGEPCYTTYSEVIDGDVYTMTKIFFSDTEIVGNFSTIRVLILKTDNVNVTTVHETRTIIGRDFGVVSQDTINNTWGDQVALNRPSSINLDFDEIVNGDPVLYFTTFSGYVCRAVRERSSECDERANWKVYVLEDTSESLYGMKKFIVDSNGNRSFIYFNFTQEKLFSFTYDNVGSKNDAANWVATDIDIACQGTGANFNVELLKNYIFTLETGGIKLVIYTGGTTVANIANPANYSEYTICGATSASATSYIDGGATAATVWQPTWIQLVTVGGDDRYYFGNVDADSSNNYIKLSYIRWFELTGADPTNQADWTFDTEIVANNNSILGDGTWVADTSSNANGASQGMMVLGGSGTVALSMFIYGVKLFDFTNKEVTILSGQEVENGDLVMDDFMDSQWGYILNCS